MLRMYASKKRTEETICHCVKSMLLDVRNQELTRGDANVNSEGLYCQSCAMPMDNPELLGTNSNGTKTEDYCIYCFNNGKFTAPDITMQEMINKCVEIMVLRNIMPEKQAKDFMTDRMPKLKRWMK
jgi:hypothetical protein